MDKPIIVMTPDQLASLISDTVTKAVSLAIVGLNFPPQSGQSEFLTRSEAKKKLRISYPTLKDWADRGYLKPYSLGGRIYYKSAEVEAAMTEIPKTKN